MRKGMATPSCLGYKKMAAAVAIALSGAAPEMVGAMEIDTGNPDIQMRWDNTVRYNAGWRMEQVNPDFARSSGHDETETKFKRGDLIINRLDLISEFDFIYKQDYGFRVSGAAWTDRAYSGRESERNTAAFPSAAGAYVDDRYNAYADRYIAGPGGEILDAFVFGNFTLGATSLKVRVGKHNVYWGEGTFTLGNSIAYSQGPVDTIKSATSPGAEAKELFMPVSQISGQFQVSDELAFAAQYLLDWEPFRLVPGGTYFATSDGSRSAFAAPGVRNGPDIKPGNKQGDLGVNVRWSPSWTDGAFGLYYRKFDEKLPWSITQLRGRTPSVRLVFARDTELFGFSVGKAIGPVAVGAEVSYRKNTALLAPNGYRVTTATTDATYDQAEGPRGNTWHALVNGTMLLKPTVLWTSGTLVGELTFQQLDKITERPNLFRGEGYAGCGATDIGCATKRSWGAQVSFTPEWVSAFPGWDLAAPMSLAYGVSGTSAALGGTAEGANTWSLGIRGTYQKKYEFNLRYIDSYAAYDPTISPTTGLTTAVSQRGSNAVQNDHGWLSFMFKTSF